MRPLPNNPDAETQLIGCCLIDGAKTVAMALDAKLRPDSFFEPARACIFGLIVDMVAKGSDISDATVLQELTRRKLLLAIGGSGVFFGYSSSVSTSASAAQLVSLVRELAEVRAIIRVCDELSEKAYSYSGEGVANLIAKPTEKLLTMASHSDGPEADWQTVVENAERLASDIIASNGVPLAGAIEFPWPQMNALFGPMQKAQMIVVAARTSIGKSSLARPLAAHAAKRQGKNVYFDTLEVHPERVALQMAASLSRVGVRQLGAAHRQDQGDFLSALRSLRSAGITMSRRDRSISQIVGRVKALHAQGKVDFAIIDHGGLIEEIASARTGSEKTAAVGRVTKALKLLAVDCDIPVVLLWQLNRGSEKDGNREPMLSDLKDSGSVEEDADKVLLIHRPDVNPITDTEQPTNSLPTDCPRFFQNVIQAKGRDDGTTFMSFMFDRATATFDPIQK